MHPALNMSFRNPTQIRLGSRGMFFNRIYRVVGRGVLGTIENGRASYWHEFYLESSEGEPITLVFEETEGDCAWRLVTMLEPRNSLTAEEAAGKKQGDTVEFDSTTAYITRVARSKVYHVEGKAPKGIVPGKAANYFNADAGSRQILVSWTGDHVEYYSGMTTTAPLVASAFKLNRFSAWRFVASRGRSWFSAQIWLSAVLVLALVGLPASCFIDMTRTGQPASATLKNDPESTLSIGASGVLNGAAFRIIGRHVVDTARLGRRSQCHEYDLRCDDDTGAVLVCETVSNAPAWFLYTPLQPDNPLTPHQADGLRVGQTVTLNGSSVSISDLLRFTLRSTDGLSLSDAQVGDVFFGFSGLMDSNRVLLVRWNQTNIAYQQGTPLAAQAVLAAFAKH